MTGQGSCLGAAGKGETGGRLCGGAAGGGSAPVSLSLSQKVYI